MMRQIAGMILIPLLVVGVWAFHGFADPTNPQGPDGPNLVGPDAGNGMVYIVRGIERRPHLRLHVYLNQAEGENRLGYTLGGQHIYFQVPAGQHTVISAGSNTKTIRFDIKAGETVFIKQNEKIDVMDGSHQDALEILPPEVGRDFVGRTVKGWIDAEHSGH